MKKQIQDGTIEVKLENTFGKPICAVHLRPADWSIVDRYNDLMKNFEGILEPLKKLDINANGTAEFEDQWAVLKEVEAELIARINAVFDMDDAGDIFAKRSPFSSVNGDFFCTIVLNALGDIITDAMEKEGKKSAKRMEKYLDDLE